MEQDSRDIKSRIGDLKGEWKTESGHYAFVEKELALTNDVWWLGVIVIGTKNIPTYWGEEGTSATPEFKLKEMRRGAIQNW